MRHLIVITLLLCPAIGRADPKTVAKPAAQMHVDDCARAQALHKQCVLDISGEEIDGNKIVPNGTDITSKVDPKQPSLIHIRREFIAEIIKSAQDL
ncbi:MAG: hypothetical protein QM831_19575 [Kofleriaceae bacterium]